MKNNSESRKKWSVILTAVFIILLISYGIMWYSVLEFNNRDMVVTEDTENTTVWAKSDANNPKGERWNSTIQISENPNDTKMFVGETVNCLVTNDNKFNIINWSYEIRPAYECYLNGFWGGSVEVHQFRNEEEIVETLPGIVANSEIKNLDTIPYINSMMVCLRPGDYFIFTPNPEVDYVLSKDSVGVVFNFYYLGSLDFSDYCVCYKNNLDLHTLWEYKLLIVIFILWLIGMACYHSLVFLNKRLLHDIKNSDQSISVMADLFLETYRINLKDYSIHLIKSNRETPILNCENKQLQDTVYQYVIDDCFEVYADDLRHFLDFSTLEQRMQDTSNLVFEYKSKTMGWISLRFFKLTGSKDTCQYILTSQDINEERLKLHTYEEHIRQAENVTLLQGSFLDTIFYALNGMVGGIRQDMGNLENTLTDESQKQLSSRVTYNIEHLLLLGNFVYDLFTIEADRFQPISENYNFYEMIEALQGMLAPFREEKEYEFILDIDKSIPAVLKGDKKRLMQILVVLLSSSMIMTKEGYIKLSVYGKKSDDTEELLFSVRDSTEGLTEEQLNEINELINNSKRKYMGNAAYVYFYIMNQILKKMGSELKIVSVYGSGSEFYFSLEQKIVNGD